MQQRSEATRQRIMASSIKLFSARGYDETSVDEICVEAEVSKGAFYYHFESKQKLFIALLEAWLKTFDQAVQSPRDMSAPETLLRMTNAFPYIFESASNNLPMFLEFWLQASRNEEVWQASIAPYRRYQGYLSSLIEKGISEGSYSPTDPELAARLIVAAAMGLLLQSLLDPQGTQWEQVARESTALLVNHLLEK